MLWLKATAPKAGNQQNIASSMANQLRVQIEESRLAFVRADAVVLLGATAKRHNIDYFTLLKTDGEWKFLSLSCMGRPIESD